MRWPCDPTYSLWGQWGCSHFKNTCSRIGLFFGGSSDDETEIREDADAGLFMVGSRYLMQEYLP